MAKKKPKKKGKSKKKPSISELEKVTLNIAIQSLKDNIQWRKELIEVVDENIKLYEDTNETEFQDKRVAINLLEEAIRDQSQFYESLKVAIPDSAEKQEKVKDSYVNELASDLLKFEQEEANNDAILQEIKKDVSDLESYDGEVIDKKIVDLELEINYRQDDEFAQSLSLDNRLLKLLRSELQKNFESQIQKYQEHLMTKVDSNLNRIVEETRWWENSAYILLNRKKRLDEKIKTKNNSLKILKKDLTLRKEKFIHSSDRITNLNKKIVELNKSISQLRVEKHDKAMKKEKSDYMIDLIESYIEGLKIRKKDMNNCIENLKSNEEVIKKLEIDVVKTKDSGNILLDFIKDALVLIEREAKYCLSKTYGCPLEKTDMLGELDSLLTEATKVIHDNSHVLP